MKFLQLLAAELTEWPKGKASHLVCSASGDIFATRGGAPIFDGSDSNFAWTILGAGCGEYVYWEDIESFTLSSVPSDYATAIFTRADWEAERAKLKAPKTNGDGWVRNRGKSDKPPVADDVMVQVVLRGESKNSFDEEPYPAKAWVWRHSASYSDLMWYRIHKPAEQPVPVSEEAIQVGIDAADAGKLTPIAEVKARILSRKTAEQPVPVEKKYGFISEAQEHALTQPADTMLAIRDRIRELDTQRAEVEATYQLQISEITQERESLVQKLAGEGFSLICDKPGALLTWKRYAKDGMKINAIKEYCQLTGAGPRKAKEAVEAYQDSIGWVQPAR
jgi:hypothetical protein